MPTAIIEQNAVVGRANRLVMNKVRVVAAAFPIARFAPSDLSKVVLTGNPLRPEVEALWGANYALPSANGPLRLLVFGGSQGARAFSEIVPAALTRLSPEIKLRLTVVQQCRPEDIENVADYLAHPQAAQRIAALLPDARLIVQLRSPVERAYSDYCMLYRRGTVDGRIERHLTGRSRETRFLDGGLYRHHLTRFFDHFDPSQIQVVLYEDIQRVPEAVLEAVRHHIDAPAPITAVVPEHRHNDSRAPMLPIGMRRALAPFKGAVAPLRRHSWFAGLHRRMARRIDYPALSTDLRRRLRDYYAADVEALQTVLGRNLDHWLASEPTAESA